MRREAFLSELLRSFPSLVPLAASFYTCAGRLYVRTADGSVVATVLSTEGTQHGDLRRRERPQRRRRGRALTGVAGRGRRLLGPRVAVRAEADVRCRARCGAARRGGGGSKLGDSRRTDSTRDARRAGAQAAALARVVCVINVSTSLV